MFRSGQGPDRKPRVETTICPRRLLDEDPLDPEGFVLWWFEATRWDPWSGAPTEVEWPYPGGLMKQPGKLVAAVNLLRDEWCHVPKREAHATEERR